MIKSSLIVENTSNFVLPTSFEGLTNYIVRRSTELVDTFIKLKGRQDPPFLAEELASLRNIKEIVKDDLGEIGALLIRCPDGYILKVNRNDPPVRQNFSCAHEIGHTFLHELNYPTDLEFDEYRFNNSNSIVKIKERLCDIAAAEILMPQDIFKKYLEKIGVSINSVERLAQVFEVSIQAVAIRISQVSEKTCETIIWKQCQKRKQNGFKKGFKGYFMRKPEYKWNPSKISEAFDTNKAVMHSKAFKIGNEKIRCRMESKGFGYGQKRYVISLVFKRGDSTE